MAQYLDISGSINEVDPLDQSQSVRVVYQSVAPGTGNLPGDGTYNKQRRRHVMPADPKTPAQMSHRAAFAAAVAAWHMMPTNERDLWLPAAKQKGLSTFNAYLSATLRR